MRNLIVSIALVGCLFGCKQKPADCKLNSPMSIAITDSIESKKPYDSTADYYSMAFNSLLENKEAKQNSKFFEAMYYATHESRYVDSFNKWQLIKVKAGKAKFYYLDKMQNK